MGDDVTLTFDNSMFLKAFKEISDKLDTIAGASNKAAEKTAKGVSLSALSFIKVNAALSLAKKGLDNLMRHIPEIGKTFQIAGEIISRNLLWPLRQMLIPLLQRVLNWVRDNRALFVKLGGVLVNFFKVIISGFKAAYNIIEPFITMVKRFVQTLIGGTAGTIDTLVNMILFKINAIVIFLQTLLRPVMEEIAGLFESILNGMKAYVQGFMEAFDTSGIMKLLGDIGHEFSEIYNTLKSIFKEIGLGTDIMQKFGNVMGTVVGGALKTLLYLFKSLLQLIRLASLGMKGLFKGGDFSEFKKYWDELSKEKALDIESVINKGKNIISPQSRSSSTLNQTNSIVINVANAEEGKQVGSAVAESFSKKARDEVNRAKALKGH